jgi:hypothetical protein
VILPVQACNRSFIKTYSYAKNCGFDSIELYSVCSTEEQAKELKAEMDALDIDGTFRYDITTLRNTNEVLLNHIRDESEALQNGLIYVIMGGIAVKSPFAKILHNSTVNQLEDEMVTYPNVSVLTVRYVI